MTYQQVTLGPSGTCSVTYLLSHGHQVQPDEQLSQEFSDKSCFKAGYRIQETVNWKEGDRYLEGGGYIGENV